MVSYPQEKVAPKSGPHCQEVAPTQPSCGGHLVPLGATSKTASGTRSNTVRLARLHGRVPLGATFYTPTDTAKKMGRLRANTPNYVPCAWLREKTGTKWHPTPTYPQAGASHE